MKPIARILYRSFLMALAAVGAASCSDDPIVEENRDADRILLPGEYRFVISCDTDPTLTPKSRVSYESIESSRFSTGDHIGIFATGVEEQIQNDIFAARDLNSESPIQVLAPPAGNVTQGLKTEIPEGSDIHYLFYYPMNESWTLSTVTRGTGLTIGVEADQSTKENYEKSDFLWNYLDTEPEEPYQTIHMHHLMANIVVKIHKDSIAPGEDGEKIVTLRDIHTSASGIRLTRQTAGDMHYTPVTQSINDIKMFCQGEMGDYLVYRAAIPAWHTIAAGSPIITVNLYDRLGNVEEVTYNLAKDLSLKDGYYYTFTLRSDVKPAIPDVSDEDSWVLDVFDPETNEIVGLLCREYLRYQPDHTGSANIESIDKVTGTPYAAANSKYISSQAWVYYPLKDIEHKIPDLKKGTVLRFIYDVRANFNGAYDPDVAAAWPAPHTYGNIEQVAQGIFLADHGHTWVKGELYGESSKDWVENYMHGGEITWEKTTNPDGIEYYHIGEFKLPEIKITNNVARKYGHIAISPDGQTVGVSYTPFNGEPKAGGEVVLDDENNKVAYVLEHHLIDYFDDRNIHYPLVKIGYNNFWMSSSLRRSNHSGLGLTRLNGDDDDPFKEYINKTEILPPGYLYPFNEGEDFSEFRDCPNREEVPLLYNYPAIADDDFVPAATGDIVPDDRFICYLPEQKHVDRILNYFGWKFAAKLMTSKVRTRLEYQSWGESVKEALSQNKVTDPGYNSFAANVSGFNLRTDGKHGYNYGMGFSFGYLCGFWINNNYYSDTPGLPRGMDFEAWKVFDTNSTSALYETVDERASEANKSAQFYGVRFTMKMKGQEDSEESALSSRASRSSAAAPAPSVQKCESKIVSVPVIECKE